MQLCNKAILQINKHIVPFCSDLYQRYKMDQYEYLFLYS